MDAPDDPSVPLAERLTRFSLQRRVTVLVLLMSIVVVGFVAAVGIPVELFPRGFTGQNLIVYVPWQNAPTQEVLDKITRPLEDELGTVRGLGRVNSQSRVGGSTVFLNFKQGTDMDIAYREVRDRVERARVLFPDDIDRVFIRKEDASGIPVAVVGVGVDPDLVDSYTLIQRELVQPLQRLDGVATVRADGLEEREILIEVDKRLAEAGGLNLYQLARDLGQDNFSMASGTVRDSGKKWLLRSVATYRTLDELENRNITPNIRLKDIAAIRYEAPDKRFAVRIDGLPAVGLVILKEGEANTVEVSERVRVAVEAIQKNPRLAGLEINLMFNQGAVVVESLDQLVQGGLMGGLLAAVVLFVFLRRVRLTAIITFAIPLSILMALIVMFFWGESLNVLTILALVIGVGMLVDNSIVVAENIHRHHREGFSRRQACIQGAGEIALAITMATLTTVVVFLPVALVEGQGQFFLIRLALPLSVSLISSLFVALIFIPLSVYLTLPVRGGGYEGSWVHRRHEQINAVLRRFYELTFERFNHVYGRSLGFFLNRRLDLILLLLIVYSASYFLAYKKLNVVPQQEEDRSRFEIGVEVSNEYSFEEVAEYFAQVEGVLKRRKEDYGLKGYFVFYMSRGGRINGWLETDGPRKLGAREVGDRLLKEVPTRPGIDLFFGRENHSEDAKEVTAWVVRLFGDDATELEEVADGLRPRILAVPGVVGIRGGDDPVPSEMAMVIDRDRASASGVNPDVIAGMVGYALRGSALPKYNDGGREIPVRIRFQESDRETLSDLSAFRVPMNTGGTLPISALTHATVLNSPKGIFRSNKRITETLTVELRKEEAMRAREALMALQRDVVLPKGVSFDESQFESFNGDMANMQMAAGLSVVFIYLLMGFLFESFVLPLSIILTIPLAGLGVVWIHFIFGKDLDFLGVVGTILLIGVVVNNGIVLIDYVIRLRAEGMDRRSALLRAADRRFRPIAMTALTTIIGMIPLTVSQPSDMGMSYKSFGLTLIGGMTTATILTLLVVPVFYTLFDDLRELITRITKWIAHGPAGGDAS
jgi:hydrophobic/amphiphilic exporter-1 (mainly G- bacteria), HAE1 family